MLALPGSLLALALGWLAEAPPAPGEYVPPASTPAPPGSGEPRLRPVPFPLEGQPPRPPPPLRRQPSLRTTLADLRDPFAQPARSRVPRLHPVRLVLPDLKDPFRVPRRVQPRNWKVPRVPGDIRDPFAPGLVQRTGRRCAQPITDDGVVIQRPSALTRDGAASPCAHPLPQDLRDPFAAR